MKIESKKNDGGVTVGWKKTELTILGVYVIVFYILHVIALLFAMLVAAFGLQDQGYPGTVIFLEWLAALVVTFACFYPMFKVLTKHGFLTSFYGWMLRIAHRQETIFCNQSFVPFFVSRVMRFILWAIVTAVLCANEENVVIYGISKEIVERVVVIVALVDLFLQIAVLIGALNSEYIIEAPKNEEDIETNPVTSNQQTT